MLQFFVRSSLFIVSLLLFQNSFGQLYVNEVMASNLSTITDAQGNYDDWIEIYNAGATPVDLGGYYLTDNPSDPLAFWQLPSVPAGALIVPAGGYLILWADQETFEGPEHLNFKLSASGEMVGLYLPNLTPVDIVAFGPQISDQSYGRTIDGAASFTIFSSPTPLGPNGSSSGALQTYLATVVSPIGNGSNDASEFAGTVSLSETAISMGEGSSGGQLVGLRFQNINIPFGQTITAAYIRFRAEGLDTMPVSLSIYGEDIDNAPAFNTNLNNLSSRSLTDSVVYWNPNAWDQYYVSSNRHQSKDLKAIVQEIVDRPGWASGNAISFLISGTGTRIFTPYETDSIEAPRLVIETAITQNVNPITDLFINELLANNGSGIVDEYNQDEDWVELYNGSSNPINIGGLYLTDDFANPDKWQIAAPYVIPAGGFALIWLDDDPGQGGLHANKIKLSRSGDELALVQIINNDTTILDSVSFGPQATDVAFGRTIDGAGTWEQLSPNTPNASNSSAGPQIANLQFSLQPGMYTGLQNVQISSTTSGTDIYFTTDGKVPTQSSTLYTSTLTIDTTTTLRARAFKSGWAASKHISGTWFFGLNDSLPVVSLITDPDSFLGATDGIYIYDNGQIGSRTDWEREVNFEYFEYPGTHQLAFSQILDSRLFGRTAIYYAQKSLSFDVRPGESLTYPFFENTSNDQFKSWLLRSSSDDWSRTMFADAWLQGMMAPYLHIGIQHYRPTVLYINGDYYGINNLRDKYNQDYLRFYYDVDPDNVDLIKKVPGSSSGVNEILEGDDVHYQALKTYIQNNDLSIQANYDYVKTQMDIDDYINFSIAEMYVGNTSWRHNRRFWRPRTPDGRWRWLINDLDRGFQWSKRDADIIGQFKNDDDFFGDLMVNQEFADEFIQRMNTWTNVVFAPTRVNQIVDSVQDHVEPEIQEHIARWQPQGGLSSLNNWNNYVQEFRNFAPYRPDKIQAQMVSHFGVSSDSFNLNFIVDGSSGGSVLMHSVDFEVPDNYAGFYFKNIPIHVKAQADKGYRFVQWLETGNTNAEIIIDTAVNTVLTPIFTSKDPIITEIHYNPSNGQQYEFIELYNPSAYALDLNGYYFDDGISDTLTFSMAPLSYVVIAQDSTLWTGQGFSVYQWGSGSLDNNGEQIRLRYPGGETSEKVDYNNNAPWPESADGDGPSAALKNLELDNDNGYNWKACCGSISPGSANEVVARAPGNVSANLALWLKADADGFIFQEDSLKANTWLDQSGQGISVSQGDLSKMPTWYDDSLNSNGLLAFDGVDDLLQMTEIDDIRTVFVVNRLNNPSTQNDIPLLGHSSVYDFHGGSNGKILSSTQANASLLNGDWRQNGLAFTDPNTAHTGEHSILSVITTANVKADQLVEDRNYGRLWEGEIAEIILYDRALNTTERNEVETYLNLKYGISIPVAQHTKYTDPSYPNRITGIGKDDSLQCVQQRNSMNSEVGSIVRIRKAQDLQDGEYLFWGDNGQATTSFNKDVNGQADIAISRVWRVAQVGNPGQVKLIATAADLPAGTDRLIVSSASDFNAASTRSIPLILQDGLYLEAWLNFADGDYFTFGISRTQGPAGLTDDLLLWLQADVLDAQADGSAVGFWADVAGDDHDAMDVGGDLPSYESDANSTLNFNPTLRFDYDRLGTDSLWFNDSLSVFVVGNIDPSSDDWARIVNVDYVNHYLLSKRGANDEYAYIAKGNGSATGLDDVGDWDLISNVIGGGSGKFFIDGQEIDDRNATFLSEFEGRIAIGGNLATQPGSNIGGEKILGSIAEVVAFNRSLDDLDRQKVESYLAIKYGFTKSGNYYQNNGNVIWDSTANAPYHHDVISIARSDVSKLRQYKSKSINAGSMLTLQKSSLSNNRFFFCGHNDSAANLVASSVIAGSSYEHLKRIWKVQENTNIDPVNLSFDLNGLGMNYVNAELALIVDNDLNFSNATLITSGISVTNDIVTVSGVQLLDGDLFTLVLKSKSAVSLSISPLSINENGGNATLTLSLNVPTNNAVVVNLGLGGNATLGTDYVLASQIMTIPANASSASSTILSIDDNLFEGDETVFVEIISVSNAIEEGGLQEETLTIIEDETAPVVSFSLSPSSINENGGQATLTASLNNTVIVDVEVELAFSGQASPADYNLSAPSIVIPAGALSAAISLNASNDNLYEGNEALTVDIDNVINGTENGVQQGLITIVDDDNVPAVSISGQTFTDLSENAGTSNITFALDNISGLNTTVDLGFSGTASGTDYSIASQLTIPAGSLSANITLTGIDDAINEISETLIIDIVNVVNATENGTQNTILNILDDDDPSFGPGGIKDPLVTWVRADAGLASPTDGSPVSIWDDQSESQHPFSQASTSRQALYVLNDNVHFNYNPVILFDGINDQMATNFDLNVPYTVFAVSRMRPDGNQGRSISSANNNWLMGDHGGKMNQFYANGWVNQPNTAVDENIHLYTASGDGTQSSLYALGELLANNSSSTGAPKQLGLGAYVQGNTQYSNVEIAEVIAYADTLSDQARLRVHSYLALKYGLGLDQTLPSHYLASDGGIVWNVNAYNTYAQNLAGIGRDDLSTLNQTKSKNSQNGARLMIEAETAFGNDKQFLIWGHDGQPISSLTVSNPIGYTHRLQRTWRCAEIGETGSLNLEFDLRGTNLDLSNPLNMGLLIDKADGNFVSPNLYTTGLSIVDSTLIITGIDLEAGDWFTVCTGICPPGGWITTYTATVCDPADLRQDTVFLTSLAGCDSLVITYYGLVDSSQCSPGQVACDLAMWLDASSGVNLLGGEVESWLDKGPNNVNATTIAAGKRPVPSSTTINGYPTLYFDGANDWMKINGAVSALNGNSAIFAVFIPRSDNDDGYYLSSHLGGSNRVKFGHRPNGELIYDDDATSLATGDWRDQVVMTSFNMTPNTLTKGWVNGEVAADWTGFSSSGGDRASIGQEYDSSGNDNQTSNHWKGDLAEMIIYDAQLNDALRHRVETYLAIKYGLDIPVASHVYYDHTAYPNNLVGIGLDATQCLTQTVSRNVFDGAVLQIENPSDLDENEYWVAGHDGGLTTLAGASNQVSPLFARRMDRIWQMQETGDVGTVDLRIDLNGSGFEQEARSWALIGNTSDDFATGLTSLNIASRIENGELVFEDVNLPDGNYFTLAQFDYITLDLDVLLSGPYNTLSGLMNDGLRQANLIPTTQPYTAANGWSHNDLETTEESIFSSPIDQDAIVDWVLVELRSSTDSSTVVASRAALLQRDGDVVDTKGESDIFFRFLSAGDYFVSVRHRNHLGVMTANAYSLGLLPTTVDFTSPATAIYGTHAQKTLSSGTKLGLWSGNTNQNNTLIFQGGSNDPTLVFLKILLAPDNTSFARNYVLNGYESEDVNMDGQIIFQGGGSDSNPIFINILSHPANTGFSRNFVITEQLP
ncbi:MAG: lamin tail domain-containing protein [Bacteroidia bacterium]